MLNHAFHDIASYNCISSYPIISLWTNFNISLWFLVVSSTFPASLSPLSIQTSPASPVPPWGDGASSSGACALAKLGAGFFLWFTPNTVTRKMMNWCELMWIVKVFRQISFSCTFFQNPTSSWSHLNSLWFWAPTLNFRITFWGCQIMFTSHCLHYPILAKEWASAGTDGFSQGVGLASVVRQKVWSSTWFWDLIKININDINV